MDTIYSGHSKPKNMSVMTALQNTKGETFQTTYGNQKSIYVYRLFILIHSTETYGEPYKPTKYLITLF